MIKTTQYFYALLILAASLYSTLSHASLTPVGSYQKSCTNISIKNNGLHANCKTLTGSSHSTTLKNLDACLNSITLDGDIGNIDGNLICLPDLPKSDPSIIFPESETSINNWIYSADSVATYKHGWGIWAGLTSYVGNVSNTPTRAFETWNTTSNMLYQIESASANGIKQLATPSRKLQLDLMIPGQFKNKKGIKGKLTKSLTPVTADDGDTNIFVSVAYNPPAARHAITNKLFLQSTLNQYLKEGYTEIPNFPNNAITIKPVYKIIPKNIKNGIYR